jgi:hypothetical protein
MRRSLVAGLCLALAPTSALAAGSPDDAPIPFSDEDKTNDAERRELPKRSEGSDSVREESEYEQQERERTMAGFDDPNIGLSIEGVVGMMLLDSSRGQLVETVPAWGVRFTWEWGRLLSDETLRDALFADVTWEYAGLRDGTGMPGAACEKALISCKGKGIYGDSNYHYFSVAPAYGFTLGGKSPWSLYAQVGGGLAYQFSALHVTSAETQIAGTKPIFQYGIGFRGRPAVVADGSVRISFRIEATRYRRGYMDDTFIGGSVGATF